jgi:hypothetical protein
MFLECSKLSLQARHFVCVDGKRAMASLVLFDFSVPKPVEVLLEKTMTTVGFDEG